MGTFSKFNRFREAGEAANVNNVEKFGEPARSLFTSSKVFTVHRKMEITDENEHVVYRASTKFFTIKDKTDVVDAEDNQVAHIERKVISLHERRFITMADGTEFQLSNEIFHLIKDITNIEGLGWQMRGNILGLNFELYDENEQIIAVFAQKLISIHDKYCVDIYRPEHEAKVVAILVALQHMIKDRENRSSSSISFSSGD